MDISLVRNSSEGSRERSRDDSADGRSRERSRDDPADARSRERSRDDSTDAKSDVLSPDDGEQPGPSRVYQEDESNASKCKDSSEIPTKPDTSDSKRQISSDSDCRDSKVAKLR